MRGSLSLGGAAVVLAFVLLAPARVVPADLLEEILQDAEQEKDYAEMVTLLDTALRQPINLLAADRTEMGTIPWVSPWLADSIVVLRKRGALKKVDDLTKIEGVSPRLVDMLRPFVVVRGLERSARPWESSLRLRVIASPPSGSFRALKTYGIYGLEAPGVRAGLVIDKDRGEVRVNDFQGCYLEKQWARAKVILGNFSLASGHGLVFSSPSGQSPSTVDPGRFSRGDFGLRPYTSAGENFALRGAGVSFAGKTIDVTVATSFARFDAILDKDGRVTSLNEIGAHVTQSERDGRDALKEQLLGAAGRYRRNGLEVTVTLSRTSFNRDIVAGGLDRCKDEARMICGADLSIRAGDGILFAEGALGEGRGRAFLGGLAVDRPQADLIMVARSYSEEYLNLHSRPFAFYSGVGVGEQGLFTGFTFKPFRAGSVSVGNDVHKKSGDGEDGFADSGSETFVDLNLDVGDFGFLVGEKLAHSEDAPSAGGSTATQTSRFRSRLGVEYEAARGVELRIRYESLGATEAESGALARSSSDMLRLDASLDRWRPASFKAGFYTFSVEDYAARLYQYEAGLPYYPSLELLKSDGSRWYAVILLDMKAFGRIAAKYGRTIYTDGEESSGLLASYMMRM